MYQLFQSISSVVFLGSIAITVAYVIYLRRKKEETPTAADGLSLRERLLVIVTLFFGGIIIAGPIYYYGLRTPFPQKARSVRHIVWVYLVLIVVSVAALVYWSTKNFDKILDSSWVQEATLGEQEAEIQLVSSPREEYAGQGYTISIPSGWKELTAYDESDSEYSSKNWGSSDFLPILTIDWSNRTDTNDAVRHDEQIALENAEAHPDTYTLSRIQVAGAAEQALLIESYLDDSKTYYEITLYVHGEGNERYAITGRLLRPTPEQLAAIKEVMLSFRLR